MYLLILGVILLVMKWESWGPVAVWPWLEVLAPFGLAVVWWVVADWSGYTRRKALAHDARKARKRRERRMTELRQRPRH
jgi:small Trp-rich protein